MAISNFIRGAGHRMASVGRAVQAASHKLVPQANTPLPSQPAPAAPISAPPAEFSGQSPVSASGPMPTQADPAQAAPRGFTLPDLGPGPDATAAQYQSDEGKKQLESDLAAHQHKQDVHKAFQDLDRMYMDSHPGRDFQGEYQEQLAMLKEQESARPHGSGLARAALALGDFNPAMQQSGQSNLKTYNDNVDKDAAQSDLSFSKRMLLRQQMHQAAASEAEKTGDFRKALAESEKAALLKIDTDQQEQRNRMQQIGATNDTRVATANIRAQALRDVANRRAQVIADTHGLSGQFLATFQKEAAKAVAKYLGPHSLTTDYTPQDIDTLTSYIEHIAEMMHDQQHGTNDGGAAAFGTHPDKRTPAPAAGAKPTF